MGGWLIAVVALAGGTLLGWLGGSRLRRAAGVERAALEAAHQAERAETEVRFAKERADLTQEAENVRARESGLVQEVSQLRRDAEEARRALATLEERVAGQAVARDRELARLERALAEARTEVEEREQAPPPGPAPVAPLPTPPAARPASEAPGTSPGAPAPPASSLFLGALDADAGLNAGQRETIRIVYSRFVPRAKAGVAPTDTAVLDALDGDPNLNAGQRETIRSMYGQFMRKTRS